jgi:hypothetical protein
MRASIVDTCVITPCWAHEALANRIMIKRVLIRNRFIAPRLPPYTITPASKDLKVCHAGLDPASSLLNGFRLACPSGYSPE